MALSPNPVGADVMPLLKILSDTPGHPGYMISATPPDQAPERIPMLYGIFRAQTGGRHHLAVLNNQAILNRVSELPMASRLAIGDEHTLALGRPLNFCWARIHHEAMPFRISKISAHRTDCPAR